MPLRTEDSLNLLFMLTSSSLLAYGPMAHERGGPGLAFTYHPFLMGISFSLLMSLGFWMFNYEDLPGDWIDTRASRRRVHGLFQASGALCAAAGYVAVVLAHGSSGGALFEVSEPPTGFSSGPRWLRLAHVVVGYSALALLVVQVFLGVMKYRALTDLDDMNDDSFSVHKQLGKLAYLLGISNLFVGLWLWEAWSLPMRSVVSLTLLTSLVFGPRWDGSRGFLGSSDDSSAAVPAQGEDREGRGRKA